MNGLRRTWNYVTGTDEPVESEETIKLRKFKDRIGNDVLQDLKVRYEHNFTTRLFSVNTVHGLLLEFEDVTDSFGPYFTMESIMEEWTTYYTNVCGVVASAAKNTPVKDDLSNLELQLDMCGKTLTRLLYVRYHLVSQAHKFLRWTQHCFPNKFDKGIFRKANAITFLIDKAVEREVQRFESPEFYLNLYMMSESLAKEMINSIDEHREEFGDKVQGELIRLRSRLSGRVLNYTLIKPSKPPITFDEFPHVNCHKI